MYTPCIYNAKDYAFENISDYVFITSFSLYNM